MEYHLKPIEQFIAYYIKSQNAPIEKLDESFLRTLLGKIDVEINKIKVFISESFYSFDDEKARIQFIRNHQRRIIMIINQMSDNLVQQINDPAAIKTLQKELSDRLLELLKFLEQDYGHCLDKEMSVTMSYGNNMAFKFLKNIAALRSQLYHCDSLIDIALEPFYTFAKSEKSLYSYTQVKYLHRLIKELDRLNQKEFPGYKKDLINLLFLINFNNNDFFNYLTSMVLQDTDQLTDQREKLFKLKLHLKYFKQHNSKTDIAFLPNRRNIKDQIVAWIVEEIKFLESIMQDVPKNGVEVIKDKFQLGFTVDQLALFTRIIHDTGLIQVEKLTPFTRFISAHFSTKKQAAISASSLRNKIYKIKLKNPMSLKLELSKLIDKHL